ncbi:MAG: hypothetical protein WCK65_06625 [Rhodospirillaceae bacterium]
MLVTIGRGTSPLRGSVIGALNTAKGADIAAAANLNLGDAGGNYLKITGAATILTLGTAPAGAMRWLHVAGAITLRHDPAAIILPAGLDLTLAAGDVIVVTSEGAGLWRCLGVSPAKSDAVALFVKADSGSVVFVKTAAGTLSIKSGTRAECAGKVFRFDADTPVVMPSLSGGSDYAIYLCADGTVRADSSFTAPTGYTTANSRRIGGFHYGLVAPGTTVGQDGFRNFGSVSRSGTTTSSSKVISGLSTTTDLVPGLNVTGTGVGSATRQNAIIVSIDSSSEITLDIDSTASGTVTLTIAQPGFAWTQAALNAIAGINAWSLWDLKWYPACPDPRGMACINGAFWSAIYLVGINHGTVGASAYNQTIASGASGGSCKVPAAFGGDGTATYPFVGFYQSLDLLTAYGMRPPSYAEFSALAYGVQEGDQLNSTPAGTVHNTGFTSRWGIEQAAGVYGIWSEKQIYMNSGGWSGTGMEGRGQEYLAQRALMFGFDGPYDTSRPRAGSRCLSTMDMESFAGWYAPRGVCAHQRS